MSAIDSFVEERMRRAEPEKAALLQFILERTRRHIENILAQHIDDDFSINKMDELCQALDAAPATFDIAVLENIGVPELHHEIIAYRNKVKWDIFVSELQTVLPDDASPFSPSRIQMLNRPLFNAIRDALRREAQTNDFDWELLCEKLPEDLASRFEAKKLPPETKRAAAEEETKTVIETMDLTSAVASLRGDPKKLAYFLRLSGLGLSDQQIDRIVYVSFVGLREAMTETKLERLLKEYVEELGETEIANKIPQKTGADRITLTVKIPEGATRLLVRGPWKRDIKVNGKREITFDVVLNPGELNRISLLAYNDDAKTRSAPNEIEVSQTGDPVDIDTLIQFLSELKDETLDAISKDSARRMLFHKCLEESALRHFAGDFKQGLAYLKSLKEKQRHPFVQRVIREIDARFRKIHDMKFPFLREDEDLMFFQKYCVALIDEKRKAGDKSVILANEPGLGKTVTAQVATVDDEVLAVTPNSAASIWIEQQAMFFKRPFLTNLAGYSYADRMRILEDCKSRGVLTNIEFVRYDAEQSGPGHTRKFELLNRRRDRKKKRVTVVDEAHFLKNDSQQTEGISQLEDDFMLLLTASPYRNPASLCRVMAKLMPRDKRFKSVKAFKRAFPDNDPAALKALHLLVQPHVVRFLKSEVMPTYDRTRPVAHQPLSLPAKDHISPSEIGLFTLTEAQSQAIFEMFQDWDAWTRKYEHYMPRGDLAIEDGIRNPENQLTKQHAFRQIVNNPAYIGSADESPKHKAVMDIVDKELDGGSKVLIFCRYHEQVKAYARFLEERGIEYCMYTGEITKQGYKKDEAGRDMIFAVDEFGNYQLSNGCPVPIQSRKNRAQQGKRMLAIDYERLMFQNNAGKKVMLATYSAGSQSVTFTAATAMIFDDLPKDYTEQYQAEDRNHRIDEKRRKPEVRYYSLISKYPSSFLAGMAKHMTQKRRPNGAEAKVSAFEQWFEQGTLDEVHFANLAAQRTSFELLNNGIAADPDLVEIERQFVM